MFRNALPVNTWIQIIQGEGYIEWIVPAGVNTVEFGWYVECCRGQVEIQINAMVVVSNETMSAGSFTQPEEIPNISGIFAVTPGQMIRVISQMDSANSYVGVWVNR